jgi:CubicO group peptidase (beta-lactamase class C family)
MTPATLFTAVSLLLTGSLLFQSPSQTPEARIDAVVRSEMLAKGIPSVSVAVMRDGKMLIERAWGVADTTTGAKADASTTYQIASASKQFAAALVLQQVDRGRIALSDSITKHLAGLKPEFAAITIEQLLNHTSGLPGDYRNPALRNDPMTVEQLFAMAASTKLENAPGTTFVYSNTNYFLLAVLAEKLHGKPFASVLQDEVAKPLGLTLARCGEPKAGYATGYRLMPDGKLVDPPGMHHSQLLGAGGICATAGDLVKWTHALHNGRVLSPASYAAMTTPKGVAAANNYGLGQYVRPAPWGGMVVTHGGQSQTGHTAELQWYVDSKMAYAMLYNAGPRVPGISDLVPRVVLGVPLPSGK